jgi:hypothetical protein
MAPKPKLINTIVFNEDKLQSFTKNFFDSVDVKIIKFVYHERFNTRRKPGSMVTAIRTFVVTSPHITIYGQLINPTIVT